MKKYDIFISYSRKDFDEVNAIVEILKSRIPTLNCWFDITGIESGDEFEDKIITAIDNSSYVLFALSDNSIQSQWAKDEVMYAKNTDTKVIPLVLKGAQLKGWFLFKFGRIDCIDTTNTLQIEKLIKNLADWTGKAITNASCSNTKLDTPHVSSPSTQTIHYLNSDKQYDSKLKNGLQHGKGVFYCADGNKYEGEFREGLPNGLGTLYYVGGDKYEGKFRKGSRDGQGIMYYKDGDRYEGQFENDQPNGQGTFYYNDGAKYVGEFKEGYKDGQGIFYFTDGDRYEGQFKEDMLDGQGTLYYANGDKYVGEFKEGNRHGQGTYYYADGRQETHTYFNGNRV